MKIDAIAASDLTGAATAAILAEGQGFDGLMFPEVANDPFLAATVAVANTESIRVGTGIAVAFARNPMSVAVTASDLNRFSGGRFVLGIGTQIKPHITRRFSMPWSAPAARMREFITAVRSIWQSWQDETRLDFQGEFYQHTLMTPMFEHGPSPCGWPPIHVAAVGPAMTTMVGEVADGLLTHGLTTADYVRDVTLPRLEIGLQRSGRSRSDIEVSVPTMLVVTDDDHDPKIAVIRHMIAFYASTPAYRSVLEHHGWGALGDELYRLSKQGDWATMTGLIDDEVLHTFAAIGDAKTVALTVRQRYGGLIDRIQIGVDADTPLEEIASVLVGDR